jgi:hypothetical protein
MVVEAGVAVKIWMLSRVANEVRNFIVRGGDDVGHAAPAHDEPDRHGHEGVAKHPRRCLS